MPKLPDLPPLPEPDYFTLSEISSRWGCDDGRLFEYEISNMLEIGVFLCTTVTLKKDPDPFLENTYELDGYYRIPRKVLQHIREMP